jgi:hypothetical protein
VIVVVLVVIVAVASASAYFLIFANSTSTSTSTTTAQSSGQSSTQTSTTTSTSTTTIGISDASTTSTTLKTYSGTFNFTNPAGPFGELTFSNNDTVRTYNSVQVASGSFTFSLNPGNASGSGTGKGTLTVTTTGFCSGRTTLSYTFGIPDVAAVGGNITVFVGDPTPVNFTVPLTCTVQPNSGSSNGDTFPFLSIYPNELSVPVLPASVNETLGGGISYGFTIEPIN